MTVITQCLGSYLLSLVFIYLVVVKVGAPEVPSELRQIMKQTQELLLTARVTPENRNNIRSARQAFTMGQILHQLGHSITCVINPSHGERVIKALYMSMSLAMNLLVKAELDSPHSIFHSDERLQALAVRNYPGAVLTLSLREVTSPSRHYQEKIHQHLARTADLDGSQKQRLSRVFHSVLAIEPLLVFKDSFPDLVSSAAEMAARLSSSKRHEEDEVEAISRAIEDNLIYMEIAQLHFKQRLPTSTYHDFLKSDVERLESMGRQLFDERSANAHFRYRSFVNNMTASTIK